MKVRILVHKFGRDTFRPQHGYTAKPTKIIDIKSDGGKRKKSSYFGLTLSLKLTVKYILLAAALGIYNSATEKSRFLYFIVRMEKHAAHTQRIITLYGRYFQKKKIHVLYYNIR